MFLFPAPPLGFSNGIYTGVWCQGYVLFSYSMYEITKKYVWNCPFSYFLLKTWFPLEYETTIPQTLMMISFCIAGLPILWRELLCQSAGFQRKDHERDVAQVATPRNVHDLYFQVPKLWQPWIGIGRWWAGRWWPSKGAEAAGKGKERGFEQDHSHSSSSLNQSSPWSYSSLLDP